MVAVLTPGCFQFQVADGFDVLHEFLVGGSPCHTYCGECTPFVVGTEYAGTITAYGYAQVVRVVVVIVGTAQITHVGVACIAQTVDLLCGCQVQSVVTEVGVTQCGKVRTVEAAVAVFVRVTRIYVSQVYIVLAELALPVDNII